MSGSALPLSRAGLRLSPVRRLRPATRSRPLQLALAAAFLLHLVVALLVLVRIPAVLVPAGPPPHEAEVEVVQNDMPATGDQPVGGAGKTNAQVDAANPAPPSARPRPQAPIPPPSPDLPIAPNSELPPPQHAQAAQAAPPAPAEPVPQNGTAAQPSPSATSGDDAPAVRLATSDETEGAAGGSAETQAAPDPKAHNKLPVYPRAAANAREQGEVDMVVQVAPDGTAAGVVVVNSSGSPSLDSAAVHAVQHWKFRAALDHGTPVSSQVSVPLNFVLR